MRAGARVTVTAAAAAALSFASIRREPPPPVGRSAAATRAAVRGRRGAAAWRPLRLATKVVRRGGFCRPAGGWRWRQTRSPPPPPHQGTTGTARRRVPRVLVSRSHTVVVVVRQPLVVVVVRQSVRPVDGRLVSSHHHRNTHTHTHYDASAFYPPPPIFKIIINITARSTHTAVGVFPLTSSPVQSSAACACRWHCVLCLSVGPCHVTVGSLPLP